MEDWLVFFPNSETWIPLDEDMQLYNSAVLNMPYNYPNDKGVGEIFALEIGDTGDVYTLVNCVVSKQDHDDGDFSQVYPIVIGKVDNEGTTRDF